MNSNICVQCKKDLSKKPHRLICPLRTKSKKYTQKFDTSHIISTPVEAYNEEDSIITFGALDNKQFNFILDRNISLISTVLPSTRAYHVGINEIVIYEISHDTPNDIEAIITSGLNGCVSLMLKLVRPNSTILLMSHLDSELYIDIEYLLTILKTCMTLLNIPSWDIFTLKNNYVYLVTGDLVDNLFFMLEKIFIIIGIPVEYNNRVAQVGFFIDDDNNITIRKPNQVIHYVKTQPMIQYQFPAVLDINLDKKMKEAARLEISNFKKELKREAGRIREADRIREAAYKEREEKGCE